MKTFISIKDEKLLSEARQCIAKLGLEATQVIGDADFLIAVFDSNDANLGFLVADFLSHKKTALLLVQQGQEVPEQWNSNKYLNVAVFNETNFISLIDNFIKRHASPNVTRFNFVIPQDLERYLEWVPFRKTKSKSDFVRDLIKQEMENDAEYRQHVLEKKNNSE